MRDRTPANPHSVRPLVCHRHNSETVEGIFMKFGTGKYCEKLLSHFSLRFSLLPTTLMKVWTAVAQWLRRCATNRKVAGSIPDGVTGIFH